MLCTGIFWFQISKGDFFGVHTRERRPRPQPKAKCAHSSCFSLHYTKNKSKQSFNGALTRWEIIHTYIPSIHPSIQQQTHPLDSAIYSTLTLGVSFIQRLVRTPIWWYPFICDLLQLKKKIESIFALFYALFWFKSNFSSFLGGGDLYTSTPVFRYGGAITAALYLEEFVGNKLVGNTSNEPNGGKGGREGEKLRWIHVDFMGYNQASRPGRPEGGEAQGMRALYALVEDMFDGAAWKRRWSGCNL